MSLYVAGLRLVLFILFKILTCSESTYIYIYIYIYIYSYNLNSLKPLVHTVSVLLLGTTTGNRTCRDVRKFGSHHCSQIINISPNGESSG